MKKPITVRILVSVPDPERFDACTLCFDTIRTGFPTAKIIADINGVTHPAVYNKAAAKAQAAGVEIFLRTDEAHHGRWIHGCVENHEIDGPLVILDADTIFWKSCEDWAFTGSLLAGYSVPRMWNDFAKAVSMPRIHTSMMWFSDVPALRQALRDIYPYAHQKAGEYCPCDPFMPSVKFLYGRPIFWDSCAVLFNMIGPGNCQFFTEKHLDCFDHINSVSFYDVMCERLEDDRGLKLVANELVKQPETLKGLWPIVGAYYARKRLEGLQHHFEI